MNDQPNTTHETFPIDADFMHMVNLGLKAQGTQARIERLDGGLFLQALDHGHMQMAQEMITAFMERGRQPVPVFVASGVDASNGPFSLILHEVPNAS